MIKRQKITKPQVMEWAETARKLDLELVRDGRRHVTLDDRGEPFACMCKCNNNTRNTSEYVWHYTNGDDI